jgi:hypothetical protein
MKIATIALVVAAGALVAGCGGDKSGASGPAEKIGVQACDDYIAKVEVCLPKLSGGEKTAMQAGYKDTLEAWKQAAAKGGAEKDRLKPLCEAALASIAPQCK